MWRAVSWRLRADSVEWVGTLLQRLQRPSRSRIPGNYTDNPHTRLSFTIY